MSEPVEVSLTDTDLNLSEEDKDTSVTAENSPETQENLSIDSQTDIDTDTDSPINDEGPSTNTESDTDHSEPSESEPINFCRFYRSFIAPNDDVILTTFNDNDTIIDNPVNLYEDFPSGTKLEYTCKDNEHVYKGINSTTCLNNGTWSITPHNNKFRKYCVNPESEALRERIAYYIAFASIIVIVSVSMFFLTSCLVKRANVKKKIRAEQIERQNRQMHENQAYLENTSRFQLVR
jgi:hypothetical protein